MMLRSDHPGSHDTDCGSRLNLLLSSGSWRDETAVDQLPRLLEPMGVRSIRVRSGEEAADVIRATAIHIAVVDLGIPLREGGGGSRVEAGGGRILQLLARLDQPPPTVVVRPPQPTMRESVRSLSQALRDGAFAVLDRPLALEVMLDVMRRILARHYDDVWPELS